MNLRHFQTLAAAGALLLAAPAHAWDAQGHAAVGMVAQKYLNAQAQRQVAAILGTESLESVASWMDQLRSAHFHAGPLGSDPEALRFDNEFPKNGEWHYVDLPLGTERYEPDGPFSRPDDVVHMAEAAVDVLEGRGDKRITRREALCMLVHFVGDEHQPLHVGNGFFKVADGTVSLVEDPGECKGLANDKGGNADFYGPGKYDELHAYWDTNLPLKVAGSRDARELALVLEKLASDQSGQWATPGDYHHWPEAWASESLAAARTAYAGIAFGAETPDPRGGIKRIQIAFPATYDDACVPIARERLAKAGFHLAQILNSVRWAD